MSLTSPDYPYFKYIKTPKQIGMSDKGDLKTLGKDIDGLISYVEVLVSGKSKNIHETMLAVEKAEIAFKTMNQIRTKVIDAYKEVMRMQV